MLRTTAIGLVSAITIALCVSSPAAARGPGGSAGGMSHSVGGSTGGMSHSFGGSTGGMMGHSFSGSPGGMMNRSFSAASPGFSRGSMVAMGHDHDRDFGRRFDRDHDFDRDRFRFRRFFPGFAFGFNSFPDYDDDCFVVRRVWTPFGLRLRRIWVCG